MVRAASCRLRVLTSNLFDRRVAVAHRLDHLVADARLRIGHDVKSLVTLLHHEEAVLGIVEKGLELAAEVLVAKLVWELVRALVALDVQDPAVATLVDTVQEGLEDAVHHRALMLATNLGPNSDLFFLCVTLSNMEQSIFSFVSFLTIVLTWLVAEGFALQQHLNQVDVDRLSKIDLDVLQWIASTILYALKVMLMSGVALYVIRKDRKKETESVKGVLLVVTGLSIVDKLIAKLIKHPQSNKDKGAGDTPTHYLNASLALNVAFFVHRLNKTVQA